MIILRKLLKVVLLPVSLLLLTIRLAFELAKKTSEIVVGLFIMLIGFGLVYSIIMQQWTNLLLFAIFGGALIATMFICVFVEETCDEIRERIRRL